MTTGQRVVLVAVAVLVGLWLMAYGAHLAGAFQ